MNKLEGLPTVHYIGLEESVDRRNNLENWFQKYNITNYVPHLFKRFEECDYEIVGPHVHLLNTHSKGCIISHFSLLKELYETSNDEYFLIVEDDLSLESVEYWNFSWENFYNNLPEDWNCIQMVIIREYESNEYYFEKRRDHDWCTAAYLIKRDYIKNILDLYYQSRDLIFTLDINFTPVLEHLLFSNQNNSYSFPLFLEDCYNVKSTAVTNDDIEPLHNPEGNNHYKSYDDAINWWKNKGAHLKINQIMGMKMEHIYEHPQFGENWFSYPNLYKNIVEKFPSKSKFVEIGSWKGKSSAFMAVEIANSYKDIDFYCVDTWKGGPDHQDRDDLHTLYETFIENMKSLENYYIPMRMTSIEASQKFEDKSLDFVFIDASHEYEDVKNDIIAWLPKVKTGGIIAGHDYYVDSYDYFPGVKQAVGETLGKYELNFDENCWICVVKGNEEILSELVDFSLDTENSEKNYALAKWYEEQGHTAPAHTYYLRSAERTDDKVLAYQALIRASFCYNCQGSRDGTEKVLLENALMLLPERPEAYYFLSLIYEKKTEWQNCYIYSTLGLNCEDNVDDIGIVEYSGKHLLLFQKAVSSWWWGKSEESRELFNLLYEQYLNILDENHRKIVMENVKKLGLEFAESKSITFNLSKNYQPTSWIVDNFYENPDEVRKFALEQDYLEGGIGRGFIGRRTEQQFLFSGLQERFEEIIGRKITAWQEHGMNGRFQISWSGEPLVYHCDSQKWGGMLYLTPGAPYQCGTTLYAHKQTRARTYHDEGWNASWENVPGDCHLDGTPFEPVDVLGNVYNRLVIFDASAIHSASQYFGTVKENARLWQMFFFDTN
jgi:GR25 family glycosyltransferase involved in LPS biosynthesis